MAEQLTRVTGRLKQKDDAPFFLLNLEDIDAAVLKNISSNYPTTSLKEYLLNLKTDFETSIAAEPIPDADILALFK